jgi:hypothetical protein
MNDDNTINWPDLKPIGHIKGRLATKKDVKAGHAVFVLQSDSRESNAASLDIDIPQYALHLNKKTGEETPGVIIQAEEAAQGQKIIGFIPIGSKKLVAALLHEFTLLGTRKRRKTPAKKQIKKDGE